jgi:hypothetical protein
MQRSSSVEMAGTECASTPTLYYTAASIPHFDTLVRTVPEEDPIKPSVVETIETTSSDAHGEQQSTRQQILSTCTALAYFLTSSTLLLSVMNFVNDRVPRNTPPLPDIGHEILSPKLHPEFLGDIAMGSMYFLVICGVLFAGSKRWRMLTRFFFAYGTLYFMRVTTISATSIPLAENHCYYNYSTVENYWWNTFLGLISFGGLNKHCGDLMFSGHTCSITLIMLTFWCYYNKRYIMNSLITLIGFVGYVFIIGTRSHYTIDVLVAFYLTILVFKLTPDTIKWNVAINWLNKIRGKSSVSYQKMDMNNNTVEQQV